MSLDTTVVTQPTMAQTLGPGRLQRLRALHEALAGGLGPALSDVLRREIDVSLVGVDQLEYGRWINALPPPACLAITKADLWEDCLILDIEPVILYPMIDRLLGGQDDQPPPGRPLSDLERPLALRIARVVLEGLRHEWKNIFDAEVAFDTSQIETDPRRCRLLPRDEMVAVATLQVKLGKRQGHLRFAAPCRMFQIDGDDPGPAAEEGIPVEVTLATASISSEDLKNLQVGDVIATDTTADSSAVVSVDGQPKFLAQPGVCEGRKAVRIVEPMDTARDAPRREDA